MTMSRLMAAQILQWNIGFGWKNYNGFMEKMITEASPLQRELLHFPKVAYGSFSAIAWEKTLNIESVLAVVIFFKIFQ